MKLLVTADRIRSAISSARTEKDVEKSLRLHKIKFSYDTSAGFLAFRIPARSGSVLVYRTASRSAPFQIRSAACISAPVVYPYPLRLSGWND